MDIAITGAIGFVGVNLCPYLEFKHSIHPLSARFLKGQKFNFNQEVIIHLSGKAHDVKKVADSKIYNEANFELTKQLFEGFLISKKANTFIFMSSVKAVADSVIGVLKEDTEALPKTDFDISKRQAEIYILSKELPKNKRVFILRPCMIHGPQNKRNLNLIFNLITKKIPWPLGNYKNERSFLFIGNFNFVLDELISNKSLKSNIFNLADDEPLSTNDLVNIISKTTNSNVKILKFPKIFIKAKAVIGDFVKLPINSKRLQKVNRELCC